MRFYVQLLNFFGCVVGFVLMTQTDGSQKIEHTSILRITTHSLFFLETRFLDTQ